MSIHKTPPTPEPFPIAEFEPQIKGLIDQLFYANLHFQIGTGLRQSWREYYPEIIQAFVFWQYTIQAHDTMAVLALCRVYDNSRVADKQSLTLRRFITTVENNPTVFHATEFRKRLANNPSVNSLSQRLQPPHAAQIAKDKANCEDQRVKDLCDRRNKLIAHSDYDFTIGKNKDYYNKHPLPYSDIQLLIDRGFDILNRYSGIFIACTHSQRLASQQDQDYLKVLKSLRQLTPRES
jgi:AbiU2